MQSLGWIILLVNFLLVTNADESTDERPLISLKDGLVKGVYRKSYDGRKYSAFEGIPYAKPPVGNLRFKDPQPAQPWSGIFEATTMHTCVQNNIFTKKIEGTEDCLYINVYIPRENIDSNERLDVIVNFHGGAFMVGAPGEGSGPSKLMDRDVVYVSMNYRVGPLGFLSFGDKVIPGNYGMKDQTFALLWVKNNIERFGGNPNSVTINGASAGGASVHLHYFSPISKGLFHRGVAASGVALDPWVIRLDPYTPSKTLAKDLGCDFDNTEEILRCMQERSALQLQQTINRQYVNLDKLLPLALFAPVIEPLSDTAFLPTDPYKQFNEKTANDVPFISTMDSDEGSCPVMFYLQDADIDLVNENLPTYFPPMFEYDSYDKKFQERATKKIVEHYFDDEPISRANIKKFIKIASDRLFHLGAKKSVKLHASSMTSNAYFILMGYGGTPIPGWEDLGIPHGQDVKFYYDMNIPELGFNSTLNDEEIIMKNKLLDMLTSFAKTGVPTIEGVDFEPVPKDGSTLKYLYVTGPNDLEMVENDSFADEEFWDSIGLNENKIEYHKTYNKIEL